FFFFQAEDGIRDATVTGVQTCALPIFTGSMFTGNQVVGGRGGNGFLGRPGYGGAISNSGATVIVTIANSIFTDNQALGGYGNVEIGRASCRERMENLVNTVYG